MSNFQFNRTASVEFAGETAEGAFTTVSVRELRIRFRVRKTLMGYPSQATIEIFNLGQKVMNAVINRRYGEITLNAGYVGNDTTVFKGQIKNGRISRQGTDTIFTVFATDGGRAWERATFSKTYDTGVSIRLMLSDLIGSFPDIIEGDIEAADGFEQKEVENFSGATHKSLQRLADDYNFDWIVNEGVLDIVPRQRILDPTNIIKISAATGLIGSPTTTEIGVDMKVLINPFMIPARQIELSGVKAFNIAMGNLFFRQGLPSTVNGLFKLRDIIHKGDTRSNDWYSEVVTVDVDREARKP